MNRKTISFLGVLLGAALCLQSCGIIVLNDGVSSREEDTTETTAVTDSVTAVTTAAVQKMDKTDEYRALSDAYLRRITANGYTFDGETFFIAAPRTELITPEDTADIYSAAIYNRNQRLEEALNVRILSSATDESSYFDLLNASVLADEYFADLLMIPTYQIGSFAAGDVLMNLRSVPLLDLTQPYYFADSVTAATAGNAVYAAAGAASFEETALSAVFFNRDLFEENGVEVPYDRVYDGTWTWDAFLASCAQAEGINAYASAHNIETFSSYATQYAAELLPAMVYATSGASMVRSAAGETPAVNISEENAAVLDVIVRLYGDKNAHTDTASGVSRFHTGKSLYLIDRLYLMSWMPGSEHNWGILPLPKMTEKQTDYITLSDSSALFFAVPKNTLDAEKTSVVMSALNAASYGVLSEAYVNYAMNNLLRDNDSANMLAIISASRTFDFALAFENTTASLSDATTAGLADLANGLSVSVLIARGAAANRQLAARFPVSNP